MLSGRGIRAQPVTSLAASARSRGITLGAQAVRGDLNDPRFSKQFVNDFALITPGHEFKWEWLRPTEGQWAFDDADYMLQWATSHGLAVHGHNLCWNAGNPKWVVAAIGHGDPVQLLTNHVSTVVKRYAGRIPSWDVVNEPVAVFGKRSDGLYEGPWTSALGDRYIDVAFRAAAAADPKALLVLNIHHVEQDTNISERTRQVSLNLIRSLLGRGVPVHAIGIESHLDAALPTASAGRTAFFKAIKALGLKLFVSEIDVDDTRVAGDLATRDRAVAACYSNYLQDIVQSQLFSRIAFWTPCDKFDWLNWNAKFDATYRRADGLPHRPGLYDETVRLKPSYSAVASVLRT